MSAELIELADRVYRFRHGWIPIVPGAGGRQSSPGGLTAAGLRAGDRVRGSYGMEPGGHAPIKMHHVISAQHAGGKSTLTVADPDTGHRYKQTLPSGTHVTMTRSVSKINRDTTAARTRKLTDVATGRAAQRSAGTVGMRADAATRNLRGKRASDYQHLAAARLHASAAKGQNVPADVRQHHERLAAMHRGIAARTPGKGTRSTRGANRPSGQRGKMAKSPPPPRQAGLRSGETRAPSSGKTAGPNVGELGKASYGSHRLPKGSSALTKEGRAKAFQHGHALPPPSAGSPHGFPVTDAKSWENARKAVGRVGSPQRKALLKALLRRTAAQYGKTAALQKSWAASNTGPGLELAMAPSRYPKLAVTSPYDVMVIRGEDGQAIVRHRRGGYEIARVRRDPDGSWVAAVDGRDLTPHLRQRAALLEAIGIHNKAAGTPYHRPEPPVPVRGNEPLQPAPVQTPLMAAYGIEAISTLATPARGAADGPRVTSGPAGDVAGLSPRGATIYKKLRSRNFPHARAHAFARRAQNRVGRK
jgi:hypothetical protein